MAASAIPHSPKEVEEDAYALKKKKKEDFKSLAKKAVVKSAPISMQDRIAEILKRTGSTQLQADEQSDEENDSDKVSVTCQCEAGKLLADHCFHVQEVAQSDEKEITPLPTTNKAKAGDSKRTLQKNEESDVGDSDSDAERSSLSDSLGVSASDFEVSRLFRVWYLLPKDVLRPNDDPGSPSTEAKLGSKAFIASELLGRRLIPVSSPCCLRG
jgi:hypothetical protein